MTRNSILKQIFSALLVLITAPLSAQAPVVTCSPPLQIYLYNTCTIYPSDLIDQVVSSVPYETAIRVTGTGTGFPANANGTPVTALSLGCSDLGMVNVEVWAKDSGGATHFCETTINIYDPYNICSLSDSLVCLHAVTEKNIDIEGVGMCGLGAPSPSGGTLVTDNYGKVCTNYFPSFAYSVTPTKEDNYLNGVDILDVYLIGLHILGHQPLNTPYQLIAADANKSGTVTTFDALEIQKQILGFYPFGLPNNSSWRFVNEAQLFFNPQNPFAEVIGENDTTFEIDHFPYYFNFIGVKIGDVNHSADANTGQNEPQFDSLTAGIEERNPFTETYYFNALDRSVAAGEIFTFDVTLPQGLAAWQFTLDLPHMEILSVVPGVGLTADNFGIFPNMITAAGLNTSGQFSLQLKADSAGILSEWFRFSDQITPAYGYLYNGKKVEIALRFSNANSVSGDSGKNSIAAKVLPNPWSESARILLNLDTDGPVNCRILDAFGRTIATQQDNYVAGANIIHLNRSEMMPRGVYFYEITTRQGTASGKMIVE